MLKRLLLVLSMVIWPSFLMAQNVTVTGTITDSGSTPYANGQMTVTLVNTTGQQATFGGNPNFQRVYSAALDSTGSFSISLPPNSTANPSIQPVGTQWNFAYTSFGNYGAANVSVTITSSASISGTLSGLTRITWPTQSTGAPCGVGQSVIVVTSTTSGCGAAGIAPNSVGTNLSQVTLAKTCPASTTSGCFTVASDTQLVSDATWSATANVQVTVGAGDPQFQCPGAVYPCNSSTTGCNASQTNLPNTSCDVFKVAFGTANCRTINPDQCDASIPQGTIASIQSATQATLTSTAATASNNGTNIPRFTWGTIDTTALSAAADACYNSKTSCAVQLPCGNMMMDNSSFTRVRAVSGFNNTPVGFQGCNNGTAGTTIVIAPNFTCADAGATRGCYLDLDNATGQSGEGLWADSAQGITFWGLGEPLPAAGQFTGSAYNLVECELYSRCSNIAVLGSFWNFTSAKTVYGLSCSRAILCDNDTVWVAGNFGLFAQPSIQQTTTVLGGYYGNTSFDSCTIGGTGVGNGVQIVAFRGVGCGFQVTGASNTYGALKIASTVTTQFDDFGSSYNSTLFFSGGLSELHGSNFYPGAGGGSAAVFVNNANARVDMFGASYPVAANTFPWLSISAGSVYFHCGNLGHYDAGNAATITGGSLIVDPCQVGGDTQLAKAAAQTAKTIFTVGGTTTLYRVHLSVECTTTSAAATVTPSVIYTDTSNTVQTITGTNATCTTLGAASNTSQDVTFRAKNATNIQYQTTIANTPTYDINVTVEQLSLN